MTDSEKRDIFMNVTTDAVPGVKMLDSINRHSTGKDTDYERLKNYLLFQDELKDKNETKCKTFYTSNHEINRRGRVARGGKTERADVNFRGFLLWAVWA